MVKIPIEDLSCCSSPWPLLSGVVPGGPAAMRSVATVASSWPSRSMRRRRKTREAPEGATPGATKVGATRGSTQQ